MLKEQEKIHTYECPQCGAALVYSPAAHGLACAHCGYEQRIDAPAAGRTAGEAEFTEEALAQADRGWRAGSLQLQCQQCGGEALLPAGALTQTCPYCGSQQVARRKPPDDLLRPRFMIPFQITPEKRRAVTQEWLGSSWMTPRALRKEAAQGKYTPLYAPFWTFDAKTSADWTAEVGYDRTETYWQGGKMRTRTVTDWRRESGRVQRSFDDLYVAGTEHLRDTLVERVTDYDMGRLVAYNPDYLAGHQAQAYEITLNEARTTAQQRMQARTREACRADALSGAADRVRGLTMHNYQLSDEKWRYVLLPVYVSAYKYRGKTYQTLVNGQNGTVGGQRPVSWWKVLPVALAPLLLLVVLLGASTTDLFVAEVARSKLAEFLYPVSFVLLAASLAWARKIVKQARYVEAAGADDDHKTPPGTSGIPQARLRGQALALVPLVIGALLFLTGMISFIGGNSSLGRSLYAPAAMRSIFKLAQTLHLTGISFGVSSILAMVGFYLFFWGLNWVRTKWPGGR